ncbi:MAG: hypothetical protein ABIB47_05580 [Candidatus Woesearchaeota archaeon]
MKSQVHVQVQDSTYRRKLLLECTRSTILMLKDYKYLEEMWQTRNRKTQVLRKLLKQIQEEVNRIDLKEIPGFKTPTSKKEKYQKVELKEPHQIKHKETDQFTLDLQEIERKLNSL